MENSGKNTAPIFLMAMLFIVFLNSPRVTESNPGGMDISIKILLWAGGVAAIVLFLFVIVRLIKKRKNKNKDEE